MNAINQANALNKTNQNIFIHTPTKKHPAPRRKHPKKPKLHTRLFRNHLSRAGPDTKPFTLNDHRSLAAGDKSNATRSASVQATPVRRHTLGNVEFGYTTNKVPSTLAFAPLELITSDVGG